MHSKFLFTVPMKDLLGCQGADAHVHNIVQWLRMRSRFVWSGKEIVHNFGLLLLLLLPHNHNLEFLKA
jgi:hypothetical protein